MDASETSSSVHAQTEPGREREAEAAPLELPLRLAELMRSAALASGDMASALRELSERCCALLNVAHTSVWQLSLDETGWVCVERFERSSGRHLADAAPIAQAPPSDLAMLRGQRALSVSDLARDGYPPGLFEAYLRSAGASAVLAAPVYVRGKLLSVVCAEHVGGPRRFFTWELTTAGTLADFVALLHLGREHAAAEWHLRELRKQVDEILADRTSDVARRNADLQRELGTLQLVAETIRRSERDLLGLFAASPVPMLLVRCKDQRVLMANEKCSAVLRGDLSALRDLPVRELFDKPKEAESLLSVRGDSGHEQAQEVELKAVSGEVFWALVSASQVVFSGEATIMLGFTDLTAQKAVEHQLRFLAQRDPLTQAYNRHHFWQLANAEMGRVKRYRRPLSLAMIDADHFKRVNDQHGHDVGDAVLRSIVEVCHDNLRKHDVLARYGGEEFVVMLPETEVEGAVAVMERVRKRIESTALSLDDGSCVAVTVSIGLAQLKGLDEPLASLLRRADHGLYEAKRLGRNRVEVGQ